MSFLETGKPVRRLHLFKSLSSERISAELCVYFLIPPSAYQAPSTSPHCPRINLHNDVQQKRKEVLYFTAGCLKDKVYSLPHRNKRGLSLPPGSPTKDSQIGTVPRLIEVNKWERGASFPLWSLAINVNARTGSLAAKVIETATSFFIPWLRHPNDVYFAGRGAQVLSLHRDHSVACDWQSWWSRVRGASGKFSRQSFAGYELILSPAGRRSSGVLRLLHR